MPPQNQEQGQQKGRVKFPSVENLATKISGKLNEEIASGNEIGAFTIALMMAAAKDVMDLSYLTLIGLIQGIPIVGQAIAVVIAPLKIAVGLLLTLSLQYFLFRKGFLKKLKVRVYYWIFGFLFDNLPAFDALPIQSLMVIVAWRTVRKRAGNAREKLKQIKGRSEAELQQIYRDLVLGGSSLDQ